LPRRSPVDTCYAGRTPQQAWLTAETARRWPRKFHAD
jgi:hypothetical protein